MTAPTTRVLVRTDVDWSRMDRRGFLDQRDPTRPVAFVSAHPLDLWDEVYETDFFDYRAQLQDVAYRSFRRAGADALSIGMADLDEWWDDPAEELIVPIDDDDLLSGPLDGLARTLTDDVDVLLWPRASIVVEDDGTMGWRRPEMRCMFATNCALRKSFLRRHFDRDGLLRVLADHRAANDAVGDVLGVDAADLVLPGFRRLRHPQVGFVAHEWSLKNGHVGSIQLLQQTLNRAEPAAYLRGLGLEVQQPLPGWAEPFAPEIEALASVWSALRASVRQTARSADHGGEDGVTTRREFLVGLAATGLGGAACVRYPFPGGPRTLPDPKSSGLDHIVVMCMENRSFDHYLGWVQGATGRQEGLSYLDEAGVAHPTHRLTSFTGCGFRDPSHSYNGGRIQLNGGACDGFRRGSNDDLALGYYTRQDLPLTSQLVDHFTICDHWFAGILAPTYPNRFYTHSAATDRITNTLVVTTMPSIWDRLGDAGIPARYYYTDLPFLALYGTKHLGSATLIDQFFVDAEAGTLPPYSYVEPSFFGVNQNDDHPHADIRRGQNLMARVVKAIVESPQWERTLLIITYDEWGGFFDTVAPPRFPDLVDNPGGDSSNPDHAQAGFRVPTVLVSPFSQGGHVAPTVFEHSAIPKLVEWRFGLTPLTPRDAASNNLATALDFRPPPGRRRPEIVVPPDPGHQPCEPAPLTAAPLASGAAPADDDGATWADFAASDLVRGWDLGV